MEAMTLGYPPEQAGQISVTATKEEWQEILLDLVFVSESEDLEEGSVNLLHFLRQVGVSI